MWLLKLLEVTIAKQGFVTMSVWLNVFVFLLFHVAVYGTKVTMLIGYPQRMSCSAFKSVPFKYHVGPFK